MSANVRLFGLIVFFAAAAGGLWYWQRGVEIAVPESAQPVARDTASDPGEVAPLEVPAAQPRTQAIPARDAPQARSQRSGRGVIFGQVLDEARLPAAGATVLAQLGRTNPFDEYALNAAERSVVTGDDGRFELAGLEYGPYTLLAFTDGGSARALAHVYAYRRADETEIVLGPSGAVSGRVIDPQGNPVSGARVGLLTTMPDKPASTTGLYGYRFTTQTDAQGNFRLEHLAQGPCQLYAVADGYAVTPSAATETGNEQLEITLQTGASLSGVVKMAKSAEPIANAKLTIAGEWAPEVVDVITDEAGQFTAPLLRPGKLNVYLRDDRLALVAGQSQVITLASDASAEIFVAQGGVLEGRIVDQALGRGVVGATAEATFEIDGQRASKTATSGLEGVYRFAGLASGRYNVQVLEARGYARDEAGKTVQLEPEQELTGVDFLLRSGARIEGTVVDAGGNPVDFARVSVMKSGTERTWSDEDGYFVLGGLAPLQAVRIAADRGDAFATSEQLILPESGSLGGVVLTMSEGGYIAGEVVSDDPAVRNESMVRFRRDDERLFPARAGVRVINGRFETSALPAGRYFVSLDRQLANAQEVVLAPGERRDDLRLTPSAERAGVLGTTQIRDSVKAGMGRTTIEGHVVDPKGNPVGGVLVRARSGNRGNSGGTTDAEGAFTLQVTESAFFDVSTATELHTNVTTPNVPSGARDVVLKLELTATIFAYVVPTGGGTAPNRVEAVALSQPPARPDWAYQVKWVGLPLEEGALKLTGVQAKQNLVLAVRAEGFIANTVAVPPIPPGDTSYPLSIVLTPGARIEGEIRNTAGEVVSGAIVTRTDFPRRTVEIARSDASGRYAVDGIGETSIALRVEHPNHAAQNATATLAPGQTVVLDITLENGGVIQGVASQGDTAIANAPVTAKVTQGEKAAFNTQTGPNGEYTLNGLPPGEIEVTLHLQGRPGSRGGAVRQTAQVAMGKITQVDFDLPEDTAVLEGFILIDGVPPERGQVTVDIESELGPTQAATAADVNGAYRLEGLLPGQATVTAIINGRGDRLRRVQATIEIVAGAITRQDFQFKATGTLHGVLRGLGDDERGMLIVVQGDVDLGTPTPETLAPIQRAAVAQTHTGPDGAFRLPNLEPGEYTVLAAGVVGNPESIVEIPPGTRIVTARFQIPDGGDFTLDLDL